MKDSFIQNAPLFSSLTAAEQQAIASDLQEQHFTKGEVLFAQGQLLLKLYLIQAGWVKLTTTVEGGRNIVNNLGAGSLVGEMDMLLAQSAASAAQAVSEVTVWTLTQSDLENLVCAQPSIGLKLSAVLGKRLKALDKYLVKNRLQRMELFAQLNETELMAIAESLQPFEIRRGGLVFRAGAPGETMFIIESGEVAVTSAAEESGEMFRTLRTGELVGEMAVLTGRPYDAMARAATEVALWAWHRKDFLNLTTYYPNIRTVLSEHVSQALSSAEQAVAQKQLTKLSLFAGLPETVLSAISSVLVLRHYPAGKSIFKLGDAGDALVLVDSGDVRLESELEALRFVRPGGYYGEMALMTGQSRTVHAYADTDCNLWLLYKSDYDELLARYPTLGTTLSHAVSTQLNSQNHTFVNHQLRNVSIFNKLGDAELQDIAQMMESLTFRRGEVVYTEGQPGDAVYFIESGEMQLATRVSDSPKLSFELLRAGSFFGEMALLTDSPRKNTARAAASDTQVWRLTKDAFDALVFRYPQLSWALSKALNERLARTESQPTPLAQIRSATTPRATQSTLAPTSRPTTARPSPTPAVARARPPARPTIKQSAPLTIKPNTPQAKLAASTSRHGTTRAFGYARPVPGQPVPARPNTSRALVPVQQKPNSMALVVTQGVTWAAERPLGFKLQVASLLMLFVWLCGIAAPVTLFSAANSPEGQEFIASLTSPDNPSSPARRLAAMQPTFTPTPLPTATPEATAVPPKPSPTKAPVVVIAQPTSTPTTVRRTIVAPVATATSAPVQIQAASVENEFKLVQVRQLTPCENNGGHHFHVLITDKAGNGLPNVQVQFIRDDGVVNDSTGKKLNETIPALGVNPNNSSGYLNWPIYKGRVRVKVLSGSSDISDWVTVDLPDQSCVKNGEVVNPIGNSLYHFSYLAVFQRTR